VTAGVAAQVATPILIANATDTDAAAVVAMYRRVLEEGEWFITYPDEFKGTSEWQAKIIREWNKESNSRFMVARMSDLIVGAISITGGNKERTHHVGMIEVFVDRSARGRGVGRALVEAAILWTEQNPILRKLALHVFEDNARAVALYADLGFKIEGRLEGEFQEMDGRLRNDLVMARQV
jgi:RimJ/RimL family protein N-acetyltransferase